MQQSEWASCSVCMKHERQAVPMPDTRCPGARAPSVPCKLRGIVLLAEVHVDRTCKQQHVFVLLPVSGKLGGWGDELCGGLKPATLLLPLQVDPSLQVDGQAGGRQSLATAAMRANNPAA